MLKNRPDSEQADVLFVCTANQCRSPVAEALLRARLSERGSALTVGSAGFLGGAISPPDASVSSLRALGLDIASHRSRALTPGLLETACVVVTMTRQHLVDLVLQNPESWESSFTFAELLGRAESTGPRRADEAVEAWARRLHAGRTRSGILGLSLSDDVPDPIGQPREVFDRVRDVLDDMTRRLAYLLASA